MTVTPAQIEARSIPVPEAGCWLWLTAVDPSGYGQIYVGGRVRYQAAHRASFEAHFGAIPEGMCVCHRCDTPRCVNPSHLFAASQLENIRDRVRKGRSRGNSSRGPRGGSRPKFWERHPHLALKIRADLRPLEEVAASHHISIRTVSRIRSALTKE